MPMQWIEMCLETLWTLCLASLYKFSLREIKSFYCTARWKTWVEPNSHKDVNFIRRKFHQKILLTFSPGVTRSVVLFRQRNSITDPCMYNAWIDPSRCRECKNWLWIDNYASALLILRCHFCFCPIWQIGYLITIHK
jgi:hypothetical protein